MFLQSLRSRVRLQTFRPSGRSCGQRRTGNRPGPQR
jgi:hypothetical protein